MVDDAETTPTHMTFFVTSCWVETEFRDIEFSIGLQIKSKCFPHGRYSTEHSYTHGYIPQKEAHSETIKN